ncbi:MAG: DUF4003 domain-containing protein [Clostridia bacterium]|nr:DUF4003 domain-containing protein [Clostridia bacterium]
MEQNLLNLCEKYLQNRDTVKQAFPWESSYFYPVCASILTDRGFTGDAERLKECNQLLKEKTSVFSDFRGSSRLAMISMIATSADPAETLRRAMCVHDALKEVFFGSSYLPVASMILAQTIEEYRFETVATRTRTLYNLMKKEHPFLTSQEDSVYAAMLALSPETDDKIIRETEECYDIVRQTFHSANAVQSLSHALALIEGTASDKCEKTARLFRILKERGYRYGTEYELPTLGVLANLPLPTEKVADLLIEVADWLKGKPGYGIMGMTKTQRLMHAGMLVTGYVTGGAQLMQGAAVSGTVSQIAAQQASMIATQNAAMCAAIAASTAAAAASNAAH